MKSIGQIFTIARFEIKTLLRSWFFRIFAFVGVFIITFFNLAMLLAQGPRWNMRAVASVIPYSNMIMLNIAQSVIIAFLATEFMKRDKKLDTTEVIYIRSMSNGVYILGKSVGTLVIFLLLNLFILLVTGVINGLMEGVDLDLYSYLVYLLLMSVPTLIYIMGLSYFLMLVLRNQAVTFVVLLGYIAVCLFYLQDKAGYVFDYMLFSFPMFRSNFIGFADLDLVLLQRGIYLALGLGFIFLTILMIGRLRQSRSMTTSAIVLAVIFLATGIALGLSYVNDDLQAEVARKEMQDVQARYADQPNAAVAAMDIDLEHLGNEIRVTADLELLNKGEDLERIFILLNPGMEVEKISHNGKDLGFLRIKQVLELDMEMAKGEKAHLQLVYQGSIDQDAMYLDINEEQWDLTYRVAFYSVGKEYGFIRPGYVLLTQEALWYPSTRIPFNDEKGIMNPVQFSNYTLNVKSDPSILPISQGERTKTGEGEYRFVAEYPLPQVSLVIGDYVERSVIVDSTEYLLAMKSDHFYFDEFFPTITDTLVQTLKEIRNDFELELELNYPYKRFSVVEVPAMFVSFPRIYTVAKEVMQPEMTFLPEKGLSLFNADFAFRKETMQRQNEQRGGEFTEVELEARLLSQFLTSTLTISNQNNFFSNNAPAIFTSSYSIFPSYYSYTNYVRSDSWAFFNKAFEGFLWRKVAPPSQARWNSATTGEEDANIVMAQKPFVEIVRTEEDEIVNNVISGTGNYVLSMIQQEMGDEAFSRSIRDFVAAHKFESVGIGEFETAILGQDEKRISGMIDEMVSSTDLPGYLVNNVESYSFKDEDRTRYAIKMDISNTGSKTGIVQLFVRLGGRGGRGGGMGGGFDMPFMDFGGGGRGNDNGVRKLVRIEAGHTDRVQMVLDEEPRMVQVNTLVSINLPSVVTYPLTATEESDRIFEESVSSLQTDQIPVAGNEVIVDDSDPGFSVTAGKEVTPLRALILGEQLTDDEKYSPMAWRAPGKWTQTISAWAYGNEVRSAFFIGTGDGGEKATWETEMADGAYYDVYVYVNSRMRWGGGRRENIEDEYHYSVFSDDGETEITLELQNAENGWNSLGSYYISPGTARVVLSNLGKGRTVVADAVKWVKR